MKVLVFDTETTGLPKDNSNIYRTDMWPHVLQLSYLMYDTEKNKIITNQDDPMNKINEGNTVDVRGRRRMLADKKKTATWY